MRQEHIIKMHEQAKQAFGYSTHEIADYRESWRIFRIMAEFVEGYQFLSQLEQDVTILGSARLSKDTEYYKIAYELGKLLGKNGFTVITGGGPGIMEAANRGAHEVGGKSAGLNIQLPFEQVLNPFVTKFTSFNYFFTRKVMLTSPANAFVFFPGGFGTMDEFFEVVDLMDLGMMHHVQVVLVGSSYWNTLLRFLELSCGKVDSVKKKKIRRWHVVDSAQEAFALLKDVEDTAHSCDLSPNNFHCVGNIDWKIFRIMAELVEGFEFLTQVRNDITILGTHAISQQSKYYVDARRLGQRMAQAGYTVVTGGKFGIAEAVNRGAFESGGESIGLGMEVQGHAELNPFLTKSLLFKFPFTRKLIVTAPSTAFVFFPGGFGTLHQLFEVLTLMQTKKMQRRPIILYDREFWQPLHEFIKTVFVHDVETVSDPDDELYQVVDEVDSIMAVLES